MPYIVTYTVCPLFIQNKYSKSNLKLLINIVKIFMPHTDAKVFV